MPLQLVGRTKQVNVGKRLRLQLYEPGSGSASSAPDAPPQVFSWWRSGKREPYPSTLHVTLRDVLPPAVVEPNLRSFTPLQAVCRCTRCSAVHQTARKYPAPIPSRLCRLSYCTVRVYV